MLTLPRKLPHSVNSILVSRKIGSAEDRKISTYQRELATKLYHNGDWKIFEFTYGKQRIIISNIQKCPRTRRFFYRISKYGHYSFFTIYILLPLTSLWYLVPFHQLLSFSDQGVSPNTKFPHFYCVPKLLLSKPDYPPKRFNVANSIFTKFQYGN